MGLLGFDSKCERGLDLKGGVIAIGEDEVRQSIMEEDLR